MKRVGLSRVSVCGSALVAALLAAGAGCSSGGERGPENGGGGGGGPNEPAPRTPATEVELAVEASVLEPLLAQLDATREETAETLLAESAVAFEAELGHDPRAALGLTEIQGSPLALNADELELLGEHGFVILRRKRYPSFPYGYFDIYAADLPVYVSADMVLEAVKSEAKRS